MGTTGRFILFQVLIIVPFLSGIVIKSYFKFNDIASFTRKLIRVNLIFIEPVIAFWSTWGLGLKADLVILPLSGVFLVLTGMILGRLFMRPLGLSGKKGAAFLVSSSLANHGFTMGAFFCYLMMGERGLGLGFLFLSYFMPFIFLVIFPYARKISSGKPFNVDFVLDFFLSLQNMPLFAVILALILLASGITRPAAAFPIDVPILLSITLYYFTLGLNFQMPVFFASGKENACLAAIKFILVPMIAFIILKFLNLDPALETVILVQAFMPAAIYSVVASVLFDLDAGFSSNLFVWNTMIFLICVLPSLFIFRYTIFSLPV
jgi:malate permease and related proteins